MPNRKQSQRGLTYRFETLRLRKLPPGARVAGIDEAGIGSWAGPVVAAAVCLDPKEIPQGLADSKRLSAKRRDELFETIMEDALAVGVGIAEVDVVDRDNVLAASHWAMGQAIKGLSTAPDLALVDGLYAPRLGCRSEAVVDGDALVASIAAASIVAKVTRDRIMLRLAEQFPGYGFESHKGYGTTGHRQALLRLGVATCHRRTFKPIQQISEQHSRTHAGQAVNPLNLEIRQET